MPTLDVVLACLPCLSSCQSPLQDHGPSMGRLVLSILPKLADQLCRAPHASSLIEPRNVLFGCTDRLMRA